MTNTYLFRTALWLLNLLCDRLEARWYATHGERRHDAFAHFNLAERACAELNQLAAATDDLDSNLDDN